MFSKVFSAFLAYFEMCLEMSAGKLCFWAITESPPPAGLTTQICKHPIFKNIKTQISSRFIYALEHRRWRDKLGGQPVPMKSGDSNFTPLAVRRPACMFKPNNTNSQIQRVFSICSARCTLQ
jgi:hypothetical protein